MAKISPKKGDIVFIDGWGGIIGKVDSVEDHGLTLKWPEGLSPYNYCNPQPFHSDDVFNKTTVLTADVVFEKMLEMLSVKLGTATETAVSAIKHELSKITPYRRRAK